MLKKFDDKVVFAATVNGIRTLKDNTLSLTLHTQEFTRDDAGTLFSFVNNFVGVVIKSGDITTDEFDNLDDSIKIKASVKKKEDKSMSKKLRDVLYIKWKELGGYEETELTSDEFYNNRMQQFIDNEIKIIQKLKG